MESLLNAAEEIRQAEELRSRANLLRRLGADELAHDLEAIAEISQRKALAISRINLPSDPVLTDASHARRCAWLAVQHTAATKHHRAPYVFDRLRIRNGGHSQGISVGFLRIAFTDAQEEVTQNARS